MDDGVAVAEGGADVVEAAVVAAADVFFGVFLLGLIKKD